MNNIKDMNNTIEITSQQKKLFDYILSNNLDKKLLISSNDAPLFEKYSFKYYGFYANVKITKDKTIATTKKKSKSKKTIRSKFMCALQKSKQNKNSKAKSTMTYLAENYGIKKKELKMTLEINKDVQYNNHTFSLMYNNRTLILVVDNKNYFDWNTNELVKKSKLKRSEVLKSFREKKVKVNINISYCKSKRDYKDFGTLFRIFI